MSKQRSFPSRLAREDLRAYLRRNRARLVLISLGYLALGVAITGFLIAIAGHRRTSWFMAGLFVGVWLTMYVAMIGLAWLASSQPAMRYVRGALGEDNTRDMLKAAARKRTIWGFVEGITTRGGDVDHLVVTRSGGVLAIDSKWCNEVNPDLLDRMAMSAQAAARRAESVMRSENVGVLKRESKARHRVDGAAHRVRPVVVVWGAESHKMPSSATRLGVEFVAGLNLPNWLRLLEGDSVDEATAADLLGRLAAFGRT